VPQQSIELARAYISVPTNAIGTEGERETLMRELRREMTASVLRRIDAAAGGGSLVGGSDEVFLELTDAAKAAMEAADSLEPLPEEAAPADAEPTDSVLDSAPMPQPPVEQEADPVDPTPGQPR